MPSPLHLDVLVAPSKPIVGLIPPDERGRGDLAGHLCLSDHRRARRGAGRRRPHPGDAEHVAKWIGATGKNLTTIYITHGHADHFFGLNPGLYRQLTAGCAARLGRV